MHTNVCRTDSSSIHITSGSSIGLLNLPFVFMFNQLFYQKPQIINGVLPLLLHCSRRRTHSWAAEVSISIEAILATYCAFDAETFSISSYTDIIDGIPVYLRVVIFWPRRSRPCRRRGPVYQEKHQNIWSKSSNVRNHEK